MSAQQTILDVLARCTTGTTLALPAAAFGPGPIEQALEACCGGSLTLNGAAVATTASAVTVTGTGASDPFRSAAVTIAFAEAQANGADVVTAHLTALLPAGWTLDAGWPLLAGSFVTGLDLGGGTLTLDSGDGTGSSAALSFAGTLAFGSAWGSAAWLLAGAGPLGVAGPILVQDGVPVLRWSVPLGEPIEVPLLPKVEAHLQLACVAVATPKGAMPVEPSARAPPPYYPQPSLMLVADVEIERTTVPIAIDVSRPEGFVAITVGVEELVGDVFATLGSFLGVDLVQYLPRGGEFDPSGGIPLQSFELLIAPEQSTLVNARALLGSDVLRWTVAPGVEITAIELLLEVPHPVTPSTVFSTLFGTVKVGSGSLEVSCAYAEHITLAAVLGPEPVQLDALLTQIGLPAGTLPPLELDQFEMVVTPATSAWSLTTAITGDWSFDLGLLTVALTEAWAELVHTPGEEPATSGTIGLTAVLGRSFTLKGTWTLPGTFALSAAFPDVTLASLASAFTGAAPPALGEVSLTNASASIVLNTTTGDYDLALAASAANGTHVLGSAYFEIARQGGGWGFLAGFVLPSEWSPAELWSGLAFLDGLTIEQAGMTVSTLGAAKPNLPASSVPSAPPSVAEGVAFFATLALSGALDPLAWLFDNPVTLDLRGVVGLGSATDTQITATLAAPAGKNAMSFGDLELTFDASKQTVVLEANGTYTFGSGDWQSTLTLAGIGTVTLEPPSASVSLAVERWQPFGIRGLLVDEVALSVAADEERLHLGLLGALTIGEGDAAFRLTLGADVADFEAPDALVFELETVSGKTVMLATMIEQFTELDLSQVPVLGEIGFASLGFYCIAIPEGWTIGTYRYPPGIGVHGDITLYDWEAIFDFELQESTGVIASGAITKPIVLGDVLTISDTTGLKGPSGSIDTTHLAARPVASTALTPITALAAAAPAAPPPYFTLDATVDLLGVKTKVLAHASGASFDFELRFAFREALGVGLACSLSGGTSFHASAEIDFDLDVTLGPWPATGPAVIPQVHIDGPTGAASLALTLGEQALFELKFGLQFTWETIDVNVSFDLTAAEIGQDLTKLDSAVTTWLEEHVEAVFADVLDDATRWIELVKSGVLQLEADAEQIAELLKRQFDVAVADAADLLWQLDYEFVAMVKALVRWFDVSAEEAARLLGNPSGSCAVGTGDELLRAGPEAPPLGEPHGPTTFERSLFALTDDPAGRQLLTHYLAHRDELDRIVARDPAIASAVRALAGASAPPPTRAALAAVLVQLRPLASPGLRASIDAVLPGLRADPDQPLAALAADARD